jgi:hypothetical protein
MAAPADYVAVAARSVPRDQSARYEVSRPREMPDWSMTRGSRWYVCVRKDGATPELLLIGTSGRAETRIVDAGLHFCNGATYQAFTPAPNAIPVRLSPGPKMPIMPESERAELEKDKSRPVPKPD